MEARISHLSRQPAETDAAFAERLRRSAEHCIRDADREWPHHAAQSRRMAQEMLEEATALTNQGSGG